MSHLASALLIAVAVSPDAGVVPAQQGPAPALAAFVGLWTNGEAPPRRVDLVWTRTARGLQGSLAHVAADGTRAVDESYAIEPHGDGWSLVLRNLRDPGTSLSGTELEQIARGARRPPRPAARSPGAPRSSVVPLEFDGTLESGNFEQVFRFARTKRPPAGRGRDTSEPALIQITVGREGLLFEQAHYRRWIALWQHLRLRALPAGAPQRHD